MTGTLRIGLLVLVLASCSENFDYINPETFNASIKDKTDIQSAEQLISLYYNYPEKEGAPHITINIKKITGNTLEITMIHDNQEDDSQRAIKIIMIAQHLNRKWKVLEIKKNWKCWNGRGHTNWGTKYCN